MPSSTLQITPQTPFTIDESPQETSAKPASRKPSRTLYIGENSSTKDPIDSSIEMKKLHYPPQRLHNGDDQNIANIAAGTDVERDKTDSSAEGCLACQTQDGNQKTSLEDTFNSSNETTPAHANLTQPSGEDSDFGYVICRIVGHKKACKKTPYQVPWYGYGPAKTSVSLKATYRSTSYHGFVAQ